MNNIKNSRLKLYYIDEKYVNYLRKYDSKVAFNKDVYVGHNDTNYRFNTFQR